MKKECRQDDFLFVENDEIEHICFLFKGAAGYVVQLQQNIVYLEVNEGDEFGIFDISHLCIIEDQKMIKILKN